MEVRFLLCVVYFMGLQASFGDACFPAKYWISCLLNTCKLGGKCPGDPAAQCRMEKSECNGCKAVWYDTNGMKANCSAKSNLQICPGGEPVVQCLVNACNWPCSHPEFKSAPCRMNNCGSCSAEYHVRGAWRHCPIRAENISGEQLPVDNVVASSLALGCRQVPCSIEVCIGQRCPSAPRAVCRPDSCNICKPAWYLDNQRIECTSEGIIQPLSMVPSNGPSWQRTCSPGENLVPCGPSVCDQKICRNFPNAECRPDGCGSCRDTWYVDNVLVDCLSDECPPNVPFMKCVDDPCKYFSHYCPAAECRASQCGKCEAKFFANGVEIDCAQPPKQCPVGVEPQFCPWFTCPANICPSNRRLMCRIDPCGPQCKYEWVDIYNGEVMGCRTFDGKGGPDSSAPAGDGKIFLRDPLSSFFEPKANHQTPLYIEGPRNDRLGISVMGGTFDQNPKVKVGTGMAKPNHIPTIDKSLREEILAKSKMDTAANIAEQGMATGGVKQPPVNIGSVNVEPIFIRQAPAIIDTDVLSILRSFPHEVSAISSAAIKTALQKEPSVDPMLFEIGAVPEEKFPVASVPGNIGAIPKIPNLSQQVEPSMGMVMQEPSSFQLGNFIETPLQDIMAGKPNFEQKQPVKPLYEELALIPGAPGQEVKKAKAADMPSTVPDLVDIPLDTLGIASGKPSHMTNIVKTEQAKPKDIVKIPPPAKDNNKSVPRNMNLFTQWNGA